MRKPLSELTRAIQDQAQAIAELAAAIEEFARETTPEELEQLRGNS